MGQSTPSHVRGRKFSYCLDSASLLLYGRSMKKDKARDIARGVLPSTARKGARDNKRAYHSTHRSAQRQVNNAVLRHITTVAEDGGLCSDPDLFDDFEDLDTFDGYHAATKKPSIGWDDMNEIVSIRRGADKLGPLIAWARATEKNKMVGWSVEDKLAYFKAVLPDSLQGRHALGHVETALDLHTDEFYRRFGRYRRPDPVTKEKFRANLARHLSTTKGRVALREFLHETVPVAAHFTETNNKVLSRVQARDEEGRLRFLEPHLTPGRPGYLPRRPYMVDVYIPQVVAVTCDVCSFLRNDPLATTKTVNHFVEVVWDRPKSGLDPWYLRHRHNTPVHPFRRKIIDYVCSDA